MSENIIEFKNVTKTFLDGKIVANDKVSFAIKKGTVHAIAGENGAGKSTLLSMLFGLYKPTSGEIFVRGQKISYRSAAEAMADKLGMVQQHFQLVEKYTVGQNIILGKEKTTFGFIRTKEDFKKINEISKKYGFGIKADQKITSLTVGQEQKTEILKLLFSEAEILIFDEPTAMLIPSEIEELIEVMRILKNEGKTIILITHKLDEIKSIADEVSVIRRGKYIGNITNKELTAEKLSKMMIGSDLVEVSKEYSKGAEKVLGVQNLVVSGAGKSWLSVNFEKKKQEIDNLLESDKLSFVKKPLLKTSEWFKLLKRMLDEKPWSASNVDAAKLKGVSFELKAGEILAIAGVEGNGQSQLANAILGLDKIKTGSIKVAVNSNELDITKLSIKKRNKLFSSIPEDRHKYGMILDMKVSDNMVIKNFDSEYTKFGFLQKGKIKSHSAKILSKYDVRGADGGNALARGLSGGNQQKAVVGREISANKDVMIVFQATRGLDVGAINYIHEQIIKSRNEGKGILLISYDLNEVIKLADRVLVINAGRFTGELSNKDITKNKLGVLMSAKGVK